MDLENENRIVTTSEMNGDSEIEYSLRPKRLAEYIGQKKAKENLSNLHRGGKKARRLARPRFAVRPSRFGEDNACRNNCERDGCKPVELHRDLR